MSIQLLTDKNSNRYEKILYIAIAIFYLHMPEPVNANRFETSANNIVFAVPESQKFSVAQVGDALSSDGAQRARRKEIQPGEISWQRW